MNLKDISDIKTVLELLLECKYREPVYLMDKDECKYVLMDGLEYKDITGLINSLLRIIELKFGSLDKALEEFGEDKFVNIERNTPS